MKNYNKLLQFSVIANHALRRDVAIYFFLERLPRRYTPRNDVVTMLLLNKKEA
jgi:hypothetical protein